MFKKVLRNIKRNLNFIIYVVVSFFVVLSWENKHPAIKIAYIVLWVITILIVIIFFLRVKISNAKFINDCLSARNAFKVCHIIRYRAYLRGDLKMAEDFDNAIKRDQDFLLENLKYAMEKVRFTKKQKKLLQKAIEDVEYMIDNIKPQ